MPLILALGRPRQDDHNLKANLDQMVSCFLKAAVTNVGINTNPVLSTSSLSRFHIRVHLTFLYTDNTSIILNTWSYFITRFSQPHAINILQVIFQWDVISLSCDEELKSFW